VVVGDSLTNGLQRNRQQRNSPMLQERTMTRRKHKPELPPDVVIGEAENPYRHAGAQQRIVVAFATRDDPLRAMLARGQIDTAQFQAGRLWQQYDEQAEIGTLKAIDTTKEPVDGGGSYPEPITDRQREAVGALSEARSHLGSFGSKLVASVLGRRLSIVQAASERGLTTNRGVNYLSKRFVECLETLAVLWKLAMRP
jgi:hypothetical protein